MSVWDITVKPENLRFGNAQVFLYKIKSDSEIAKQEGNHTHSYYELHFISQGSHPYSIAQKSICVHADELLVISPGTEHKAALPQKETVIHVLSIQIKRLNHGENIYPILIEHLDSISGTAIPLTHKLVQNVKEYATHAEHLNVGDLFHRKLSACNILVGIFDAIGCSSVSCANDTHVDFDILLETLVFNSDVPLCEIAKRLGYSTRQISRKIQKRYSRSFSQIRKEPR